MKKIQFGSFALVLSLASTFALAATPAKTKAVASKAPAENKVTGKLSESAGSTEFLAVGHPSALKVVGKGPSPKGDVAIEPGKISGTATFDLQSLDTGIETRNEHMKTKYLETGKFPQSSLKIVKLAVPANATTADFSAASAPFEGMLTLHGVEKPITGTADVKRSGAQLDLVVHFSLKISDYGIPTPGYAGITMADEVQVTVKDSAALVAAK
jgi:polyisoprenoid-binding protein YceI